MSWHRSFMASLKLRAIPTSTPPHSHYETRADTHDYFQPLTFRCHQFFGVYKALQAPHTFKSLSRNFALPK